MKIINDISSQRFTLDGIEYLKNFLSRVYGNKITIYNAYDKDDVIIENELYTNVEVNGVVYGSAALLQQALLSVIYTRATLGGIVQDSPYFNYFNNIEGFSLVGQDLTINANWAWTIQGGANTNPSSVLINIPFTTTGYHRIDIVVANANNGFDLIQGVEVLLANSPAEPSTPIGTLKVTSLVVTDGTISSPELPITGTDFVKKTFALGYSYSSGTTDAVFAFRPSGESVYTFTNAGLVSVSGFNLSLITGSAEVPYSGKTIRVLNQTGSAITLKHFDDINAEVPFSFKDGLDVTMPFNEILEFTYANGELSEVFRSWTNALVNTDGLAEGVTNLYFTVARVLATVLTGFTSVVSWARITSTDTILQAFGKAQKQIDDLQSSSVFSYTRNVNAGDNTKFDFVVSGIIRNPSTKLVTLITNQTFTAQSVTHNANGVTYFGLKEDLTLTQQSTRFTTEQRYNHLCEWAVIYNTGTNVIITFNDYPNTSEQLSQQLHNYMKNAGVRNLGNNQYTSFGTTILNIYKPTGGVVEGVGWGALDSDNPNEKSMPSISSADTFTIRYSGGNHLTGQTVIDPTIYEPNGAGVVSTVPLSTDVTVYRISFFNSNLTATQLGQTIFSSIDEAIARTVAKSDNYITNQNIADNGITVTYLAIQKNCTAWSQTSRFRFFPAPQSGSAAAATFVTFDSIYNSVSAPQLTLLDSKGSFDFKSGMASNASKVMRWLDNTGVEKLWIKGDGTNNFGGFTPLFSTITSTDISTQDATGLATYINGLVSSFAVEVNEIKYYEVSDTGQKFMLKLNNRSFGGSEPDITASDIFEISPEQSLEISRWTFTDFHTSQNNSNFLIGAAVNGGSVDSNTYTSTTKDNYPSSVLLFSGTSANGGYRYTTYASGASGGGFKAQKGLTFFGIFTISANSSADTLIRIGLHTSVTQADSTDGAYLEIQGTTATFKTANNSSRSSSSTATLSYSTTPTETYYLMMIHFDSLTSVSCKIKDDAGTTVMNQTLTTSVPASGRRFGCGVIGTITTAGTSRQILECDYIGVGVRKPNFLKNF